MPSTSNEWISEIAAAYADAYEAIPFGILVGKKITEEDLFHMTPGICLKFRGIEETKENLSKATEAMLSSYLHNKDREEELFRDPHILFGFSYLASHFGLELVSEEKVSEVMEFMEGHRAELGEIIESKINNPAASYGVVVSERKNI